MRTLQVRGSHTTHTHTHTHTYAVYGADFVGAGDWSEVLEALDEPLRADDPLVAMCKHCERPSLVCRKCVLATHVSAVAVSVVCVGVCVCVGCRPELMLRCREVEALRSILGENASAEGAALFVEGKPYEAMQKLLMAYTYYPWHLDERYALPLLQTMRAFGLYEEALHLSVEFLRYHHFTRDKERALVRSLSPSDCDCVCVCV